MSKTSVVGSVGSSARMEFWDRREFLCGWGAALINICTTFPINKIMFRQMVHGVRAQSAINQLRTEGLRNLYKGLLPPLLSKTASVSLMFGSYSSYRSFLDHNSLLLPKPIVRLSIAAFLSGSTEAVLCPFERIQMLLQSRDLGQRFHNTFQAKFHARHPPDGIPMPGIGSCGVRTEQWVQDETERRKEEEDLNAVACVS